MLRKCDDYRFLYITIAISIALHIMIACNIALNDNTVYAKHDPNILSEITVQYVIKTPAPSVSEVVKEINPVKIAEPAAEKKPSTEKIIKEKAVQKKTMEKVKALEAPVFKEVSEPKPQPEAIVNEHSEPLPEAVPQGDTDDLESLVIEEEIIENSGQSAPVNYISEDKLNDIRQKIKEHLSYPSAAKRMGWTGTVKVEISLYSDGELKGVRILGSSGYRALDKIVIKSVNKSAPFNVNNNEGIIVSLPVNFTINGAEM
jgi:protein TonB